MQKISYVIPCYRSQHTVGGVGGGVPAPKPTRPPYYKEGNLL